MPLVSNPGGRWLLGPLCSVPPRAPPRAAPLRAFCHPPTSMGGHLGSRSPPVRSGCGAAPHLGPGSRPTETMGREPWSGGTAPSGRGTPADRAGQRGHADEGAEKSKHLPGASFPPVLFSAFGSSAVGASCPVAGAALLPRVTSRAGLDPQPARHHSGGRGAHVPWWGLVYLGSPL